MQQNRKPEQNDAVAMVHMWQAVAHAYQCIGFHYTEHMCVCMHVRFLVLFPMFVPFLCKFVRIASAQLLQHWQQSKSKANTHTSTQQTTANKCINLQQPQKQYTKNAIEQWNFAFSATS